MTSQNRPPLASLAAKYPGVKSILEDAERPHNQAALDITAYFNGQEQTWLHGYVITESSIRRWRKAHQVQKQSPSSLSQAAEDSVDIENALRSSLSGPAVAALITEYGYKTTDSMVKQWRRNNDYVTPGHGQEPLNEDTELTARIETLKKQNKSLARQLYEIKHKHADYLETLWDAVTEAVTAQHITPVETPEVFGWEPQRVGGGKSEVAVALLSDMQTGKLTPNYNSEVCAERVSRYADKIIKITAIQEQDHPVRKCVVHCLGDMLEGVDIFPGQQWLIDSTLYTQLLDTTPVIIADFIRKLLTFFDLVDVKCVDGNHGRIGRKGQFGPMDNADRMIYRILKLMLRDEPRVTIDMTDPEGERNWFMISEIGNYRALLIHGDQIRGHNGLPWYGFQKKINSWGAGGLGLPVEADRFTDVHMGHWHQLAMIPLNQKKVWVNGSTESRNTFAQETLAAQSDPSQWLLYVQPESGHVTASYAVDLS